MTSLRLARAALFLSALFTGLALFFWVKVRQEDRAIDRFVREATRDGTITDPTETALALAQRIYERTNRGIEADRLPLYERIESTSFFNMTSAVSLDYGAFAVVGQPKYGPCGTMSRVLATSLWRLGIPARKLYLLEEPDGARGGHTMIEFFDGRAWRVLSPSDGPFAWRNAKGEIATTDEIRGDPAVLAQVRLAIPDYPYRFEGTRHIRWAKLPSWIGGAFRAVFGEPAYETAVTPRLYDRPRWLFLLFAAMGAVLSAAAALGLRALAARRASVPALEAVMSGPDALGTKARASGRPTAPASGRADRGLEPR